MNSRFVPITVALASLAIAVFFILYFQGWWRWIIASPLLVLVSWPSLKIGLFSSQPEVDKMTGADNHDCYRSSRSNFILIPLIRFLGYAAILYLGYITAPFYLVIPAGMFVFVFMAFENTRFNILMSKKREQTKKLIGSSIIFLVGDTLTCCILFAVARGIRYLVN